MCFNAYSQFVDHAVEIEMQLKSECAHALWWWWWWWCIDRETILSDGDAEGDGAHKTIDRKPNKKPQLYDQSSSAKSRVQINNSRNANAVVTQWRIMVICGIWLWTYEMNQNSFMAHRLFDIANFLFCIFHGPVLYIYLHLFWVLKKWFDPLARSRCALMIFPCGAHWLIKSDRCADPSSILVPPAGFNKI